MSFEPVPLSAVADINRLSLPETTSVEEEIAYADMSSVDLATGAVFPESIRFGDAPTRARRVVREGDSLIPYLTGKNWMATRPLLVDSAVEEVIFSTGFYSVAPRDAVDPRFLNYALGALPVLSDLEKAAQGVTMVGFSESALARIRIPFLPLPRQVEIADFLDQETQRISATMKAAQRLLELARERFAVQAINEIRGASEETSSAGLPWLGPVAVDRDVCRLGYRYEVQLGKMLNPDAASGGDLRPYLRNVNVQWDRIDVEDVNEMSFDASDRARFSLRSGDLLVCEGGDVGRCAIWEEQLPECYYQKALHRLRPRSPSKDVPRYLYFVLWVASRQGLFTSDGNQNTIPHLTAEQLRAHRFPFPSRAVQEQVVERLDSWKRGVSDVESLVIYQSRLLEERRQALISAAVTGQLDVEAVA